MTLSQKSFKHDAKVDENDIYLGLTVIKWGEIEAFLGECSMSLWGSKVPKALQSKCPNSVKYD